MTKKNSAQVRANKKWLDKNPQKKEEYKNLYGPEKRKGGIYYTTRQLKEAKSGR